LGGAAYWAGRKGIIERGQPSTSVQELGEVDEEVSLMGRRGLRSR